MERPFSSVWIRKHGESERETVKEDEVSDKGEQKREGEKENKKEWGQDTASEGEVGRGDLSVEDISVHWCLPPSLSL